MADNTNNNNPLGQDSLKGGIFFGSNLTPNGTFTNVPQVSSTAPPSNPAEAKLILTLEQVKEELQKNATNIQGSSEDVLSDSALNTFLQSYVQLLIDYSNMRNYVFYGSAYTELTYHIDYLVKNYPFKSFLAKNVLSYPSNVITLTPQSGNNTLISFEIANVLQPANYNFNNDGLTQWLNFDIVDENGTRFPILNAAFNVSTFTITAATNTPTINITTSAAHGLINGDIVTINGVLGNTNANGTHIVDNITPTTFDLLGISGNGAYLSGGTFTLNKIDLLVSGSLSLNNLIEFNPSISELYKGLIISPKLKTINDFNVNIDPIQKELISPNNPTPWPRALVTNNLIISGGDYDSWIENPANMASGFDVDADGVISLGDVEGMPFTAGLTMDESETNQLIRRAIPHRLIDELRDTEDKFFSRFILLAGKMFDTIKVYIDFLKYTKELNYTPFNQLSPDFYKVYAEHFGFDLFDDENVDLAKAIIVTEPGLSYDNSNNAVYNDTNTSKTVKELQAEKQKRLLINLFYLYSTKGTLKCIDALAKLLGSPEGLVVFNSLIFNQTTGQKETDNDKIKVPKIAYEIDPDYLVDPNNITSPVNFPYVYRLKLDNEHIVNLRELEGYTDPNGAIHQQVINYGTQTYPYGYFGPRSFATLQNNDTTNPDGYYLLPLTFPDKYCGVTIEYMLPRDGFIKGVGNNYDEASIHLASLYQVDSITSIVDPDKPDFLPASNQYAYRIPQVFMESIIPKDNTITKPFKASFTINALSGTPGDTISVQVGATTIGSVNWLTTKKATALAITNAINFNQNNNDYIAYYKEDIGGLTYTITVESQKDSTPSIAPNQTMTVLLNAGLDPNSLPNSQVMSNGVDILPNAQFIIAKLEGKDLVIRLLLNDETIIGLPSQHRVAIFKNLFSTDGLNHKLRLTYRPEGVEVYQDFKFLGLARWRDPGTLMSPKNSWDCPKSEILNATELPLPDIFAYPDDEDDVVEGNNPGFDTPQWWDLFVGLPVNVNMFFKSIAIQEIPSIDHPDTLDFGLDISGQEVEKFSFNFKNQIKDINENYILNSLSVPAEYKSPNPFPANALAEPDIIDTTFSGYADSIVTDLRLVSQSYLRDAEVRFTQDIQNYFSLPNGEVVTIDSLFKFNGWSPTIHKDYTYENYNKVFTNYQIFSEQVLTYLSLLPFMELVEGKFKQLVSQFIPIVINITNFGRLVKPLEKIKIHYPNIHKTCEGNIIGCDSNGTFRIVHGTNNEYADTTNNITIRIEISKLITNASNASPIVITTSVPHNFTNASIIDVVGVNGNTAANVIANPINVLTDFTFELTGTIGSGSYTGGGNAIEAPVILIEDWHDSNTLTAETIVTNFNAIDPMFTVSNTLNSIAIGVEPGAFLTTYNHEINDCTLTIIEGGNVQVDSVSGFSGGYPSITTGGCFTIEVVNKSTVTIIPGFKYPYIYFGAEQAKKSYIYFDSEVFLPEPSYYIYNSFE